MKNIITMFLVILLCMFICDVIYQANNTEVVLLSGEIMGFEIENYFVSTSSQKLGVVTCIKKDTSQFSALGHQATQNYDESNIEGICYEIDIDEIDKSYNNHIGHIHGILNNDTQIGTISQNNKYGIFGTLDKTKKYISNEIQTASKYEVRLGDAELLISWKDDELQSYKVEIVSINYISDNKNIKIKVKDDNLKNITGGIVQGMSGAPIVQNGKLIGAINYANAEKPEEAYAIFIDKLI